MIRGVHHISVHVRDLDRMIEFYKAALGFEPAGEQFSWTQDDSNPERVLGVRGTAARGVMLRAGNCYVELFEYASPEPVSVRPLEAFDKGYTHFCVDIQDIENEYERLKDLGVTFCGPAPVDVTDDVTTVYGRDPEGNLIEFQQVNLGSKTGFGLDELDAVQI